MIRRGTIKPVVNNIFSSNITSGRTISILFSAPQVHLGAIKKTTKSIPDSSKLITRKLAHRNFGPIKGAQFNDFIKALNIEPGNNETDLQKNNSITDLVSTYNLTEKQLFFFQCVAFANRHIFINEANEVSRGKELYKISRTIFDERYNAFQESNERFPEIKSNEIDVIFDDIKKGEVDKYKEEKWFKPALRINSFISQYNGDIPIEKENAAKVLLEQCVNHHRITGISSSVLRGVEIENMGYTPLTRHEAGKGKEISIILGGMGSGKSIFTGRDLDRARFDADDFKSLLLEYFKNNNFDNHDLQSVGEVPTPSNLHTLSSVLKYIAIRQLRHSLSDPLKLAPNVVINQTVLYRPEVEFATNYGNPLHITHIFTDIEKVQNDIMERAKTTSRHCSPNLVIESHIKSRDSIADNIRMLRELSLNNPNQAVDYRLLYRNGKSVSTIGNYDVDSNKITLMHHGYWEELAMLGKDVSQITPNKALQEFIKELKNKSGLEAVIKKFVYNTEKFPSSEKIPIASSGYFQGVVSGEKKSGIGGRRLP